MKPKKNLQNLAKKYQKGLIFLISLLLVSGITVVVILLSLTVGMQNKGAENAIKKQELAQETKLNLTNAENLLKDLANKSEQRNLGSSNFAMNVVLVDTFSTGARRSVCHAFNNPDKALDDDPPLYTGNQYTSTAIYNGFDCKPLDQTFAMQNATDYLINLHNSMEKQNNSLIYTKTGRSQQEFKVKLTTTTPAIKIINNQVNYTIRLDSEAALTQAQEHATTIKSSKIVTVTRSCPKPIMPTTFLPGQIFNPSIRLIPVNQEVIGTLIPADQTEEAGFPFLYCTCNGATTLANGSCLACGGNYTLNENKTACRCKDGFYPVKILDPETMAYKDDPECVPCPTHGECANGTFIGCNDGYSVNTAADNTRSCNCLENQFINSQDQCVSCPVLEDSIASMANVIMEENDQRMSSTRKTEYLEEKSSAYFRDTNYFVKFAEYFFEHHTILPKYVATCNGTKNFTCYKNFYRDRNGTGDNCHVCPAQGTSCEDNRVYCDRSKSLAMDNYYFFEGNFDGSTRAGCYACPRRGKRCECRDPRVGTLQDDHQNTVWRTAFMYLANQELTPFASCHPHDTYYDQLCEYPFDERKAYGPDPRCTGNRSDDYK